jgi:acyl-CoA synthetase (AMP-forming)/AMP-acid ligase II
MLYLYSKKFSARSFTPDCLKYNVIATQYIGELCRYLLNAPANPDDRNLKIKYAFGNGMRPDVWVKFKERYNIGRIIEFYGATEGNFSLFNSTGRVGALGFIPPFLSSSMPVR